MFVVLAVIGLGAALVWSSVRRGRRFVRAADFLMILDGGSSVEEANNLSAALFTKSSNPETDRRATNRAKAVSNSQFGGKQLPLIFLAKSKGFTG